MPVPPSVPLVCDAVSWRLDLFGRALARVYAAAEGPESSVVVGYRSRDDLALVVVTPGEGTGPEFASKLVFEARLPGLRVLELPGDGPPAARILTRALEHADVVTRLGTAEEVVAVLRGRLGMLSDARAAMRLQVALPLRFEGPDGVTEASTTDLTAGGVFVRCETLPPLGTSLRIAFFPNATRGPVAGSAEVVRHTPDGFGARLALAPEDQSELYRRIQAARAPAGADPSRLKRGPTPAPAGATPAIPGGLAISAAIADTLSRHQARVLVAAATEEGRAQLGRAFEAAGFDVLRAATLDDTFGRLLEELLALDALVVDDGFAGSELASFLHRVRRVGGETQLAIVVQGAESAPAGAFEGADAVVSARAPAATAIAEVTRLLARRRAELLA